MVEDKLMGALILSKKKKEEKKLECRELGGESGAERSREKDEIFYSPAFVNTCIDIQVNRRAVFPAHELSVYVHAFECHLYVVDTGYR
jgi:hypothetical protein